MTIWKPGTLVQSSMVYQGLLLLEETQLVGIEDTPRVTPSKYIRWWHKVRKGHPNRVQGLKHSAQCYKIMNHQWDMDVTNKYWMATVLRKGHLAFVLNFWHVAPKSPLESPKGKASFCMLMRVLGSLDRISRSPEKPRHYERYYYKLPATPRLPGS